MGHHETVLPDQSRINTAGIAWSVIATIIVLTVVMVWSVIYFQGHISQELNKKQITEAPLPLRELRLYELEQLNKLEWVSRSAGIVRIPRDNAIDLVLRQYR